MELKRDRTIWDLNQGSKAVIIFVIPKISNPIETRFILDYILRNKVTIKDQTTLLNMEEILDFVVSRPFRSKLDLTDGYHNIRIEPDSVLHSIFLISMGYFNSQVMQQGDCNAPATMMKVINHIFKDMLGQHLIIYLNDILIASYTYQEYISILRKVFQRLTENQFFLNKRKYQIMPRILQILGHILTCDGLMADLNKLKQV